MCGICGIYNYRNNEPIQKDVLERMTQSLIHRGPDAEGFFVQGNIGLGHRRLSIIDLLGGNQPMYGDDKNVVIVYKGEIYNYIELRNELKSLGFKFATDSDTEVIIKAYQAWGLDFQNKLNGMWAFALWDNRKKELLLSRDRIGEKPLYYAEFSDKFIFGSEIKSIIAYGFLAEANLELIEIYLSLGYIPAPFTFYKNIWKLKAGHFLIVKAEGIKEYKYWDLPSIDENNMLSDEREICEQFEHLLKDSVSLRMRSDVPFGAFLSGGLDSSSIVALMSEISNFPVETFTVGFNSKDYDERELAWQVSRKFSTNHHEKIVSFDSYDKSLEKVLFSCDEVFGDSSAIPTNCISQYARQKVKMVLSGDGGDEVLSGYTTYQGEKFASQYQKLPNFLKKSVPAVFSSLGRLAKGKIRYQINRITDVCASSSMGFQERLQEKSSWIKAEILKSLLTGLPSRITMYDFLEDLMRQCGYKDNFYKIMYFNLKVSLPDDMLVKVDRMSMAHSLEVRAPFLDYRLIEYMVKVSKNIKMSGYRRKNTLRKTVGKRLPPVLLKIPKKGFVAPLREWFKEKLFEDKLNNLYRLCRYGLDRNILRQIINANKNGERDYGNFIWMLAVLDSWISNYNTK